MIVSAFLIVNELYSLMLPIQGCLEWHNLVLFQSVSFCFKDE